MGRRTMALDCLNWVVPIFLESGEFSGCRIRQWHMTADCICQMLHEMRERDFVAGKGWMEGMHLVRKTCCFYNSISDMFWKALMYIILYYIISYYFIVLYCIILSYVILSYIILSFTVLSYIILSYLIWYDIILHYIVKYDMTWPLLWLCLSYDIYIYIMYTWSHPLTLDTPQKPSLGPSCRGCLARQHLIEHTPRDHVGRRYGLDDFAGESSVEKLSNVEHIYIYIKYIFYILYIIYIYVRVPHSFVLSYGW